MNDFYKIIACPQFRSTEKVKFNEIPMIDGTKAITRVEHGENAFSPGSLGDVEHPWYMHPHQEDNLIVFFGTRIVHLYTKEAGEVLEFKVTPDKIWMNGELVHDGPAILHWDTDVFHRVQSQDEGSMSVNFAVRHPEFDIRTNFNIYDLNVENGEFETLREGHEDQKDTD